MDRPGYADIRMAAEMATAARAKRRVRTRGERADGGGGEP